jgi:hypothetical protein
MRPSSVLIHAVLLGGIWLEATCSQAEVKVVAGPLPTNGEFQLKDKVRRSLSGVACPVSVEGKYICLVAFDEGAEGRTIAINDVRYDAAGEPVTFGPEDSEMDSEGVAADDRFYYVAGSHSNKRKDDCATNDDSHRVVKIAFDPETGLPLRKANGKLKEIDDGFNIEKALTDDLRKSLGKCLGSAGAGFDIEGLAAYEGRLYFGLRGPTAPDAESSEHAIAQVFETETSPLKSDDAAKHPFLIRVDRGKAIRDMAAVEEGILLLVGPDDDNGDVGWSIAFWSVDEKADRNSPITATDLGRVDLAGIKRDVCDKEVKPEGMALLETVFEAGTTVYRLAIFSDGMCDGGPVIVEASRTAS